MCSAEHIVSKGLAADATVVPMRAGKRFATPSSVQAAADNGRSHRPDQTKSPTSTCTSEREQRAVTALNNVTFSSENSMQPSTSAQFQRAMASNHLTDKVAPYEPTDDLLTKSLSEELTYCALYHSQDRKPLRFDKTFFSGLRQKSLARLHVLDAQGELAWVHPRLTQLLLYRCNHSNKISREFVSWVKSGRVRSLLDQRFHTAAFGEKVLPKHALPLATYLESVPSSVFPMLQKFTRSEDFRQAVAAIPAASMTLDEAVDTLSRLSEEYGLDTVASATLAAIARGVLPVRQQSGAKEHDIRFIFALATLVDPKTVARPTQDDSALAIVALKADRLCRIAGVDASLPIAPLETLVADLAHAFGRIGEGDSYLKTIESQVEIVDTHYLHVSDARALSMVLQDTAPLAHVMDADLAETLAAIVGTSAFLRETLEYEALRRLISDANRLMSARGVDGQIGVQECRLASERRVKSEWYRRAGLVRRVRRYGAHVLQQAA